MSAVQMGTVTHNGRRHSTVSDGIVGRSLAQPMTSTVEEKEYAMNKYTLSYKDSETELRYTRFSYIHSGFYGGKLWHVLSIIAFFYNALLFHKLGLSANFVDKITDRRYVLVNITVLSSSLTFICLFFERLYPYREHLLLVSFASHWPALATLVAIGKKPETVSYAVCLTCYFFCAFISQVRFCRLFPFLTVTPLLTLIVLVTTQTSYFETHAMTEIAFWPSVFFPIILLRAFEVCNRKSFETVEKSERRVHDLGLKVEMAQQTVANFFPPTPTIDLLIPPCRLYDEGSPCRTPPAERMDDEANEEREMNSIGSPERSSAKLAWSASSQRSLNRHAKETSMRYSECAMIVTDLAGFTQWTASCAHDPSIVIALLTKMFLNIDQIMPLYRVEKIATVGDAFIGVIFNDCPSNPGKVGLRASHAMQFGCDILNTASSASTGSDHSLQMRVGVHVGNLVGGFVGTSPPKFDVFGSDFEKAKVMESSGRPEHVHASKETVVACTVWERTNGSGVPFDFKDADVIKEFCSRHQSYKTTELGVLCSEWVWVSPTKTFEDTVAAEELHDSNDLNQFQNIISSNAIEICEKLIKMQHDDSQSVAAKPTAPLEADEESRPSPAVHVVEDLESTTGEAEETDNDLGFSFIWLEFDGNSTERHYQASILSGDLLTSTYFILGLLQFVLVFAHAMNGCVDTVGNRLVLSGCIALTTFWIGFVHQKGIKSIASVGLIIGCSILTYIVSVFQTTGCHSRGVVVNTSNIIINYYILAAITSQFALNVVLKYRFLMLIMTTIVVYATYPIRLAVVGEDGVFAYDMNLVFYATAVFILVGVSYFVDFSQRAAFSSSRKLHRLLLSAKGKHADTATQAMDIMLPSFVCDALTHSGSRTSILESDDDADDGSVSENSHLTGGVSSTGSSRVIDLEVLRDGMVWEYPSVVVMFIKFVPTTQPGPVEEVDLSDSSTMKNMIEDYDEINSIIKKLERVITHNSVQKVKTIGSTMLAVAGIDKDCTEPFTKVFLAALQAQEVLSERSEFTIGISSGACFGAVIGVKGLCFDIFGDTVNTASRMCTTATPGSIQLTDQTRLTALALGQVPTNSTMEPTAVPVMVKGKGAMDVFRLIHH